tara:strand:- start:3702 stop:3917 length:216 start_codon:yes stop_codon:yes gene_type:complete
MGFKYKLLIGVLLSFSFVFFVNAITIAEFKELTDEQLQTWNYEFIENTHKVWIQFIILRWMYIVIMNQQIL